MVNIIIKPEMIPEGEGELKYRSPEQAKKIRVERAARILRIDTGCTYQEALKAAADNDTDRHAELYLANPSGIGGNAFGKPPSVQRI